MEEISPDPPDLPGLRWQLVGRDDLTALEDLAQACHQIDGGLGFQFKREALKERYFPEKLGTALGAFTVGEKLAACTSLYLDREKDGQRITIVGLVRPDYRHQGIGTYLLRWSQKTAASIQERSAGPIILQIVSDAVTEPAERLYFANGFQKVFDSFVMRYDLHDPLPDRPLPAGLEIASWNPERAHEFYQAYQAAFRERPGFPGWSAGEWIAHVTENDHVPEWSQVAFRDGRPVGFIIGNADLTVNPPDGFIWQVGVIPGERGNGLGSALLIETMHRMQARGASKADLTVNANNPGAIEVYTRLGFTAAGRRGRFERTPRPRDGL